jgi:hypothetical protein
MDRVPKARRRGPAAARAVAGLLAAALAAPAPAADRPAPAAVTVDWKVDGAITGGAIALWLGSELAKDSLAPAGCRWCATNSFDTGARDAVVWSDLTAAKHVSDALVLAVPAGVALYDGLAVGGARAAAPDLLLVGEAIAISGVLAQGT